MDTVYCVFAARGEDEGNVTFNLLEVCRSLQVANEYVNSYMQTHVYPQEASFDLIHKDMTKATNYTFVGKRLECDLQTDRWFGAFCGHVIEKMPVR